MLAGESPCLCLIKVFCSSFVSIPMLTDNSRVDRVEARVGAEVKAQANARPTKGLSTYFALFNTKKPSKQHFDGLSLANKFAD